MTDYITKDCKLPRNETRYVMSCNEFVMKVFDYENFRIAGVKEDGTKDSKSRPDRSANAESWSKDSYVKLMNIHICPYCNADTVYAVPKSLRYDRNVQCYVSPLDHFLPQSLYPFLALSLSNLVPSCARCNTNYKLDRNPLKKDCKKLDRKRSLNYVQSVDMRCAHPYIDDIYSKFNFEVKYKDGTSLCCDNINIIDMTEDNLVVDYCNVLPDKVHRLLEDLFITKGTINCVFMTEVCELLNRMRRFSEDQQYAAMRNLGIEKPIDVPMLVCGFEPTPDEAMRHSHGKLFIDILRQFKYIK